MGDHLYRTRSTKAAFVNILLSKTSKTLVSHSVMGKNLLTADIPAMMLLRMPPHVAIKVPEIDQAVAPSPCRWGVTNDLVVGSIHDVADSTAESRRTGHENIR